MNEFKPEKAMNALDKQKSKELRLSVRHEKKRHKQARNLAKHAVREANKAKVGELIKQKLTKRFNPLRGRPAGGDRIDIHNKANIILEDQGLRVQPLNLHGHSSSTSMDPYTFRHLTQLELGGGKPKKLEEIELMPANYSPRRNK